LVAGVCKICYNKQRHNDGLFSWDSPFLLSIIKELEENIRITLINNSFNTMEIITILVSNDIWIRSNII
jgi:hypothetical protein